MIFKWLESKWNSLVTWIRKIFIPEVVQNIPLSQPVTALELTKIPEKLNLVDIKAHYLFLYHQLMDINRDHYNQDSKIDGPLANHRIIVEDDGLLHISEKEEKNLSYTLDEAKRIAVAIYQLAYAYTLNPANKDTVLLNLGIAPFLMLPFAKIHGTDDVRTISHYFRQLIRSFRRKINEEELGKTPEEKQTHSAQIIQRAYRKHLSYKQPQSPEVLSEELKQSMQNHMISENPKHPEPVLVLSAEHKRHWAQSAKPGFGDIALKVAMQLVNYRSHTQFMGRLRGVVKQFNDYIHSLPKQAQEYVIIVPRESSPKSNHWVTGLAIPNLIKKPMAILYPNEIDLFILQNPNVKNMVFIDDALYSGRQMEDLITSSKKNGINSNLLLPFYTDNITWLQQNNINCFLGERMLKPENLVRDHRSKSASWTNNDRDQLNEALASDWSQASSKVGTFFNHRVGDSASTFLGDLPHLHQNGESLIPSGINCNRSAYKL